MERRQLLIAALSTAAVSQWPRALALDEPTEAPAARPPAKRLAKPGEERLDERLDQATRPVLVLITDPLRGEAPTRADHSARGRSEVGVREFGVWLMHASDQDLAALSHLDLVVVPRGVLEERFPELPVAPAPDWVLVRADAERTLRPVLLEGWPESARIKRTMRGLLDSEGLERHEDVQRLAQEARLKWVLGAIPGTRWTAWVGCGSRAVAARYRAHTKTSGILCGMGRLTLWSRPARRTLSLR